MSLVAAWCHAPASCLLTSSSVASSIPFPPAESSCAVRASISTPSWSWFWAALHISTVTGPRGRLLAGARLQASCACLV